MSGVATTIPEGPNSKVTSLTRHVGRINSRTITVPSEVQVFPESSVAVKITGLIPTSSHEKLEGVIVKKRLSSQLSELPSSTNRAGKGIVISINKSTKAFPETHSGAKVSRTETMDSQELVLPASSSTVKTTVFKPIASQSKELISIEVVTSEHSSELPLSTSEAKILAIPS